MLEIEKPKLECVEITENYGKFVVEPLERGFGTTLGNSMRRVLLSSLPGVAATSIRIDGVLHEFSTIEGVKEDVTEIILNIKELICKLHCPGPKKVIIDAAGECEVKAGDILPVRDGGIVYFFSMATSFTKAALGAEGIGKDVTMIVGNGYTKDHADITLNVLRENPKLRKLFEEKYV